MWTLASNLYNSFFAYKITLLLIHTAQDNTAVSSEILWDGNELISVLLLQFSLAVVHEVVIMCHLLTMGLYVCVFVRVCCYNSHCMKAGSVPIFAIIIYILDLQFSWKKNNKEIHNSSFAHQTGQSKHPLEVCDYHYIFYSINSVSPGQPFDHIHAFALALQDQRSQKMPLYNNAFNHGAKALPQVSSMLSVFTAYGIRIQLLKRDVNLNLHMKLLRKLKTQLTSENFLLIYQVLQFKEIVKPVHQCIFF